MKLYTFKVLIIIFIPFVLYAQSFDLGFILESKEIMTQYGMSSARDYLNNEAISMPISLYYYNLDGDSDNGNEAILYNAQLVYNYKGFGFNLKGGILVIVKNDLINLNISTNKNEYHYSIIKYDKQHNDINCKFKIKMED